MDIGLEYVIPVLIGAVTTFFKSFKFVQEGELGIKLRFGRALKDRAGQPRIIRPGFVWLIPFVETLQRHHVRQQTLRLDNQKVMIAQRLIFNVNAVVILRVKDIYKALFEIDDLDNSIIDLSMGILRDVLSKKNHHELENMSAISDKLLEELKEKADEWGVEFLQFKLTDCAPTPETAPLLNAEAGVELKMQALQKAVKDSGLPFQEFPSNVAAALIGVPVVTSIQQTFRATRQTAPLKEEKKGFLRSLIEDGN